jgi:Tfp pilus assembly protein FimT
MVIVIVIAGMTVPKVMTIVQNLRTGGDAQNLNSAILLAKMRAASDFARARVHADLTAQTYWVEVQPSGSSSWSTEGGTPIS